jgi:hypothetical protein
LLGVVIREVGWAWYAALIGEMTEFIWLGTGIGGWFEEGQ